jgi:nucleosome-remodeling factor subunit BPTF
MKGGNLFTKPLHVFFLYHLFNFSASQPQFKTFIRKILVRNADGTSKVISETVTQSVNAGATTPAALPKPDQPQKIQVMRTPDGKMSVRGLQPNQKLVQTSDGKYLILPTNSNGE